MRSAIQCVGRSGWLHAAGGRASSASGPLLRRGISVRAEQQTGPGILVALSERLPGSPRNFRPARPLVGAAPKRDWAGHRLERRCAGMNARPTHEENFGWVAAQNSYVLSRTSPASLGCRRQGAVRYVSTAWEFAGETGFSSRTGGEIRRGVCGDGSITGSGR